MPIKYRVNASLSFPRPEEIEFIVETLESIVVKVRDSEHCYSKRSPTLNYYDTLEEAKQALREFYAKRLEALALSLQQVKQAAEELENSN